MSGEPGDQSHDLVVRASRVAVATGIYLAVFNGVVIGVIVGEWRRDTGSGNAVAALTAVAVLVLSVLPHLCVRLDLKAGGVYAVNVMRRFEAPWQDVAGFTLVDVRRLAPFGPERIALRVETKQGQQFTIRASTWLDIRTINDIGRVLRSRAATFGFTLPAELMAMRPPYAKSTQHSPTSS